MSWSRRPVDQVSAEISDHDLLIQIGEIHHEFLERPRGEFFESLLDRILVITNSEYGFLGEVLHDADGAPYLKTYALTNLAWDEILGANAVVLVEWPDRAGPALPVADVAVHLAHVADAPGVRSVAW